MHRPRPSCHHSQRDRRRASAAARSTTEHWRSARAAAAASNASADGGAPWRHQEVERGVGGIEGDQQESVRAKVADHKGEHDQRAAEPQPAAGGFQVHGRIIITAELNPRAMTTHIHTESDLDNAIAALAALDPRWRAVFARTGRPPLRRREGGFAGLAQIIVAQQVSVASAAAIHGRLVAIAEPFDHARVLRARKDRLVRVGLSGREDQDAEGDRQGDRSRARSISRRSPTCRPTTRTRRWSRCTASARGPRTSICSPASAMPTPGRPATLRCRRPRASPSVCANRPTTKEMGPLAEGWRPYRAVAARLLWTYYRAVKKPRGRAATKLRRRQGKPQEEARHEWPVSSTVRASRRRAARRASSWCSCTAMAPTATT